ncbi:uncharacterized protein LOC131150399 isoform X2 [Malania oleifera]|nr:uncharacterized protein LOC131150399 isoform X2 [Malania oleifera]
MTIPLRLLLPLSLTTAPFCCSSSSPHFLPSKSSISFQLGNPNHASSYPNPFNPKPPSAFSFSSHLVYVGKRTSSHNHSSFSFSHKLLCMRRDQNVDGWRNEGENGVRMYGSDEEIATQVPTQAQTVVEGSGQVLVSEFKSVPDVDYLQELLAIQQQGPRSIGFFGTRNMGFMHQELIEILSYAMVITKNHIFTSGASGTNAAVIRGALRAEKPELLTVILPQSLKMQPPESQELLSKVKNVIEKPYNDHLPLIEASRL